MLLISTSSWLLSAQILKSESVDAYDELFPMCLQRFEYEGGVPEEDEWFYVLEGELTIWVDGETLPWAYTRGAVEAAAEDRLVLTPAG